MDESENAPHGEEFYELSKLLKSTVTILKECSEAVRDQQKFHFSYVQESEERITHVNRMTEKIFTVLDRIDTTYEKHISKLSVRMDSIIESNAILSKQNLKLVTKIEKLETERDHMIKKCEEKQKEYLEYVKGLVRNATPQISIDNREVK